MKNKKFKIDKENFLLGLATGLLGMGLSIHTNMYFKSCVSYYACTNAYTFLGIVLFLAISLYFKLVRNKYKIKIEKETARIDK